jgi:NAD(P)H dehydrogenase (quinone)
VTLKPKDARTLNVGTLVAEAGGVELRFGDYDLRSSDAKVLIDGRSAELQPARDLFAKFGGRADDPAFRLDGLEVGSRTVEITHPDYEPWRQAVTVRDQETTAVSVELKPKPGRLTVRADSSEIVLIVNGALLQAAQDTLLAAGHSVVVSDLYAMQFNPVSDRRNFTTVKNAAFFKQQIEELNATEVGGFATDVEAELRKMEECDLMIWQFPLWWFGLPGILKGWVDRVFAMGRTYGGERFYENGVFKGKRAMLSLTTGGPESAYRKGAWNGDIDAILRPVQRGIFRFTGWDVLAPHIVYAPVRTTPAPGDRIRPQRRASWNGVLKGRQAIHPQSPPY